MVLTWRFVSQPRASLIAEFTRSSHKAASMQSCYCKNLGVRQVIKKKQKSEGAGVVGSLHLNPSFQFPFDLPLIGVDKTNVPVACGGVILASAYSYIILFVKNYIAAIFDFYCSGRLGREINLY